MDEQGARYPSAKVIACDDFNQLDTQELKQQLIITQVIDFPTHSNKTLDLILTELTQHYLPSKALPSLGRSPHLSIIRKPTPTHQTRQKDLLATSRFCYAPVWTVDYPTPIKLSDGEDSRAQKMGMFHLHYSDGIPPLLLRENNAGSSIWCLLDHTKNKKPLKISQQGFLPQYLSVQVLAQQSNPGD